MKNILPTLDSMAKTKSVFLKIRTKTSVVQPFKAGKVHMGDLGGRKKIHRAVGMSDMPLFSGAVMHAHYKPCVWHTTGSPDSLTN